MRSHRASETRVFMARPPAVQVTTPRLQTRTWRAIWFIFSERSKEPEAVYTYSTSGSKESLHPVGRPPHSRGRVFLGARSSFEVIDPLLGFRQVLPADLPAEHDPERGECQQE